MCAKIANSEKVKGSSPEAALSVRGTSPLRPTPGVGEERVRIPQARMRKMPPSPTEGRLLDPLRSCAVTGSGKWERKSHRWKRALWPSTLLMLSAALRFEKLRNFVPHS